MTETTFDILLGDIVTLSPTTVYVRKLDFIISMIGTKRVNDIVLQWESSDQHYDYAVCEGGEELILFASEEDLCKFQFFTCLCSITQDYRLITPEDMETFQIEQ